MDQEIPTAPQTTPAVTSTEPTPAAPAAAVAPEGTPQQAARAEIYRRIYEPQTTVGESSEPAPAVPAIPAAVAAPAAPAAPLAPTTLPPEVIQALSELAGKLDALEHPAPAAPATPSEPAPDWIEYLRQGKFEEAKASLYNEVAAQVGDKIRQQATTESLQQFRLETEMNTFVQDIRTKNPDVLLLEDVIGARAEQRIVDARNSGKIKTPQEFLDVYKLAVTTEVDNARKLLQQIRASAKAEALTTRSEVISTTPVPPNAMDTQRQPAAPKEPAPLTPGDYIRQRLEASYKQRGIL